jgi:hypothetical protein
MNEDSLEKQLNQEIDMMSMNQLHQLGNKAVSLGLILGHGFFRGEYEILKQEETLLLTPEKAQIYLENLIQTAEG